MVCAKSLQSYDSCNPMDCGPPGSSVHRILQARILQWVAISFSWGSSQCRDWTNISCITGGFFTTEPPGNPSTYSLPWIFWKEHPPVSPTPFCPVFIKHPAGKDTAGTHRRIRHSYRPEEAYSLERKGIHRNTKYFITCIMEIRSLRQQHRKSLNLPPSMNTTNWQLHME